MSDEVIKNLKDLRDKHETHLSEIRTKIRILETIPLAKALDGKCFKYKGTYIFGGKKPNWVYKRVVAVSGENLMVDTFQTDGPDRVEFHFNEIEYVSRFAHPGFIPIKKKEYFKQLDLMLKALKKRGYYGEEKRRAH